MEDRKKRDYIYSKIFSHSATLVSAVMFASVLSACTSVEYTPRQKYYTIDDAKQETSAHRLHDLSKGKKMRGDYGTVHVSTSSDPKSDDVKIAIRKEKDIGPSRYKAQTRLPQFMPNDIASDFHFSFDKKRDFWLGLEFKIKNEKWMPKLFK